jgi:endoglucanase
MKKSSGLVLSWSTVACLIFAAACDDIATSSDAGRGGKSAIGGSSSSLAGQAGASGNVDNFGGAGAAETFIMVDDFEDGDNKPLLPGGWYSYTDGPGGKSTLSFTGAADGAIAMNGVGYQSQKSLEVAFTFDRGTLTYDAFVGWGASLATAAVPIDLSAYSGIAYDYLGSAHRPRVENVNVTDHDEFGANLPASTAWKTVTLPFTSLAQEGWGKKATFDATRCTNISFEARGATGTTGKVQVDNLRLLKNTGKGSPNMSVNPASPPTDGTIASLDIPNPLQQKATKYLTHGYNITNWLEQMKFAGTFTYDEAFVERLAQAGFKSLRLPIDLDNYVESKTGTGDGLSITVSVDLFTILDSFDTWTKAHGLSLTIDYHQYSTLLNKADPDSVGTAVQLWGKVAGHFAANPREDLFFELCNEPEQSFDGTDPTAAEWTAMAEQMIAAIRATDKTHSIIFGDVQWYAIDALAARKVLSDNNVIYAFHDYDPFIFTHQGTGWTTIGSVHDVPYPYTPERWSEYYADLGFSPFMESWILSAAQTYYRDGSKAALRNRILTAKRWAVTNNVPVICNEFGAYDGTSRLDDRVNYYTDIVSIFEELAIPWQHWFMIMNTAGTVTPAEYATAMGLGQ